MRLGSVFEIFKRRAAAAEQNAIAMTRIADALERVAEGMGQPRSPLAPHSTIDFGPLPLPSKEPEQPEQPPAAEPDQKPFSTAMKQVFQDVHNEMAVFRNADAVQLSVFDEPNDASADIVVGSETTPDAPANDLMVVIENLRKEGYTTYSGIARRLNSLGVKTAKDKLFYPATVSDLLKAHGIPSSDTKSHRTGRPRKGPGEPVRVKQAVSSSKAENQPKAVRVDVTDEVIRQTSGDHDLTKMMSPTTRMRAQISSDWRRTRGRSIGLSELDMIADAVAAGLITKCPPCTDSSGYDHLKGATS